jgi:hypothetical protein
MHVLLPVSLHLRSKLVPYTHAIYHYVAVSGALQEVGNYVCEKHNRQTPTELTGRSKRPSKFHKPKTGLLCAVLDTVTEESIDIAERQ